MLSILGGAGIILLINGGWLAHSGTLLFESHETSELIAGALIIAGLTSIGVSLGICFGSP
jgi:hypothetical protein